jgi:amino acid adenylation domain-containing protein
MARAAATLVAVLRERAASTPGRLAFECELSETDRRCMDYAELDRGARAVAALIQERGSAGHRILLMHPPGPEYITAFFGCLYAAAVAVPAYPPASERGLDRLRGIAQDAGAVLALSDSATVTAIGMAPDPDLNLPLAATDVLPADAAPAWSECHVSLDDLAMLQYTSGSTGRPRGVMLSHGNLAGNSATISRALSLDATSRGVSWLPPYHDMGLIGGILQPVYAGFPCTLLPPQAFVRRPLRWMEALSRTGATITAAPDFAYAQAARRSTAQERARLDLSALHHALVGAEPVRSATLAQFALAFRESGFRVSAFYPCYGLAEATLFVTGAARAAAEPVTLRVARSRLAAGQVVGAPAEPGPSAVLTGCGQAHGADTVLVVDQATGRPLPSGTVGEIWISGASVARGYLDRPAETAAAFRANVDGYPDRSFLRTGDLGFWHQGELFIAGRIKDVIVVRGRNHYPQDLEQTAESAHALLRHQRGAAFADQVGTAEGVVLVHEVSGQFRAADGPEVTAAVHAAVAAEHGLSPHQVVLVRPGSIPRTSSGKVRRSECGRRWLAGTLALAPALDGRPGAPGGSPAALTSLIADALEVPPATIAVDLPLVSQGLDSLRATQLAVAIADTGGARLSITQLLAGLTPRQLAASWTAAAAQPGQALPVPEESASAEPVLASRAQERIWLMHQLGAGAAYHITAGLRLTGPLDPDLLSECVAEVLGSCHSLRSVFSQDETDGGLRVRYLPDAEFPLPRADLTGAPDLDDRARTALSELAAAPFDLRAGPVVRLLLLRLGPQRWCLGLAAHHIVLDGWSLGLLLDGLGDAYRRRASRSAADGQPGTPPFRSAGPPARRPGTLPEDTAAFWQEQLDGAQPARLSASRLRPAVPTWHGESLPVELSAELAGRLRAAAADRGTTPFTVLLAAFAILLGRWTGQQDLVVGTIAADRDRPDTASAVGLLADLVPIRVDLSSSPEPPDFVTVVDQVRDRCLAAFAHRELSFDEIVRLAGQRTQGGQASLVRTVLVLQSLPVRSWQADGVRAEPFELPAGGAQHDLSVHLTPSADGALAGHAVYAADLFDADAIKSLLNGLPVLLEAALARPGIPVAELPVLSAADSTRISRTLADGGPAAAPGLVHDLIAAAAAAHPDVAAVSWDGGVLTYRELRARTNSLARRLRALGVGPDQPVAICLPRSAELIVALCAVLTAEGCYLPLDLAHPPARLASQFRDAGARILIADGETPALIVEDNAGAQVLAPDQRPGSEPLLPGLPVLPGNLATVPYTSGSTGRPKAVMTTHAGLANMLAWMQREYPLAPGEAVLHKTPVSFDLGTAWEVLWPLSAGATVVLAAPGGQHDMRYLAELIVRHHVTTCHFVPSVLRAFVAEPAAGDCAAVLGRVLAIGEDLTPDLAGEFIRRLPGVRLDNLYGPTEAAIHVTAHRVTAADCRRSRIPVGRPLHGTKMYVLDSLGRIVPPLAPGELYIGGLAPARGYLGQPGLTADRFVPDPFGSGTRLYRTGDRVLQRPDGALEYLGRLDRQVKVRGNRVEPGEVEAALDRHPMVSASVVEPRPAPDGQLALTAWIEPAGPAPLLSQLRDFLLQQLPAALVPDVFCLVPQLPVGPHGKVDRAALPDPGRDGNRLGRGANERIAPRNPVERQLAGLWRELVGCPEPSVTDDFFELGGHSLLAMRLAVRVRTAFGADIPIADLLGGQLTIERLAMLVASRQLAQADQAEAEEALRWVSGLSDEQVAALLADDSPA